MADQSPSNPLTRSAVIDPIRGSMTGGGGGTTTSTALAGQSSTPLLSHRSERILLRTDRHVLDSVLTQNICDSVNALRQISPGDSTVLTGAPLINTNLSKVCNVKSTLQRSRCPARSHSSDRIDEAPIASSVSTACRRRSGAWNTLISGCVIRSLENY